MEEEEEEEQQEQQQQQRCFRRTMEKCLISTQHTSQHNTHAPAYPLLYYYCPPGTEEYNQEKK